MLLIYFNFDFSKTDRGGLIDNIFLTVGNNLQNRRIKDLKIPSSDLINKERLIIEQFTIHLYRFIEINLFIILENINDDYK